MDKYENRVIDSAFGVLKTGISDVMERTRGGDAEAAKIATGVRDRLTLLLHGAQEDLRVGYQARIKEKMGRFSDYVCQILDRAGDQKRFVMSEDDSAEFKAKALPVCDRVVGDGSYLRGVDFKEEDGGLDNDKHTVEKLLELSTGELVWLDALFDKEEKIVNFAFEEALPGSYNYGVVKKSNDGIALSRFFEGMEESMRLLCCYHHLEAGDEDWEVLFERVKDAILNRKKSISLDYGEALTLMRACAIGRSSVARLNFQPPDMGGPRLDRLNLCLPGGSLVSCRVQRFGGDSKEEKWQFVLEEE